MGSTPVSHSVLNVKALVAAFNQENALVGAFSVITNLRMDLFESLLSRLAAPDLPRLHAQGDQLEVDLRQCGQTTDDPLY